MFRILKSTTFSLFKSFLFETLTDQHYKTITTEKNNKLIRHTKESLNFFLTGKQVVRPA